MRIKRLADLAPGPYKSDNFHRIAISNLSDSERVLIRWWCKKYRTPQKPLDEHTIEELMVEMLEDYYERNPAEIQRFLDSERRILEAEDTWDGRMSPEYERGVQKRLSKIQRVDDSQFKSDVVLSPEEERAIIENLGRNLPKSRNVVSSQTPNKTMKDKPVTLGTDDFDDDFGAF